MRRARRDRAYTIPHSVAMTPPTLSSSATARPVPTRQQAAPARAAPTRSPREPRTQGAREAAGAAMRAIGRIVPMAGTSAPMVRQIRMRMAASAGPLLSPAAR